ncbi:MAG: hypothetical protein OEX02_07600 [Cyclobacteriaceae bacterium]|nr:hypothetical protein [Cyclobacteriaceae bacterium]
MELSDEEIHSLSVAIQKRYGVDFTCYEMKSLKRRIIRIMNINKMGSLFELWQKVLNDASFVEEFTNNISVGLTSMFRDPELWKFLKNYIYDYFEKKNNSQLKVWHAGCSTGEEVFSLGIVLRELGVQQKVKALASDMNSDSLKTAREGCYQIGHYEDYKSNYKVYNNFGNFDKYCQVSDNRYCMDKSLLDHVELLEHNLITEEYPGKHDIIFCRNVMIYFDTASKLKILTKFHEMLNPNGLLIIGFFDSFIPFSKGNLFTYLDTDVRVLQKNPEIV